MLRSYHPAHFGVEEEAVMPNKSPEPTAVGAVCFARSHRFAKVTVRLRLSFFR